MDFILVLHFTSLFLAIGMLISGLEILNSTTLYTANGLANWKFSKSRSAHLTKYKAYHLIFQDMFFSYLISLRVLAALVLLFSIFQLNTFLISLGYILAFLSYVSLSLRSPYGLDGSDQANLLIVLVMCVYILFQSEIIKIGVHWFLALQLTLVYLTAGWSKIRSKGWRDGTYLWKIFSTECYGMKTFGKFLKQHQHISRFLGLSIILVDMCFFLFWILPPKYAFLLLTFTGLFHLMTAILMGLNTFFWAFLAMYPSAIYCKLTISSF